MPEKRKINVTLLLYGPPERMDALLTEEKLRMANGERSPLEAFTRRVSRPTPPEWVSFRVDASVAVWNPDDPWVISVYRMMNRLIEREKALMARPPLERSLDDMVSFEFICVDTRDLSMSPSNGALPILPEGLVEVRRTHHHDGELAVRLRITP